jgi:hypothetical protein
MTRPLACITLAALLAGLSSIEVSIAQTKQQCSAASPSDPHGQWWSYRMIDGRKCWYEGKPGLSKSLLEWPREVSTRPASSEEVRSTAPEKPRTPLDSQAWAPNSKASVPSDPDTFEARWLARTVENATSVTDAGPATPKVNNDGPPLKKADKLRSLHFDSVQPKVTRTLVIVPDQPLPLPVPTPFATAAEQSDAAPPVTAPPETLPLATEDDIRQAEEEHHRHREICPHGRTYFTIEHHQYWRCKL